jgi:serine O-acetyltransferase
MLTINEEIKCDLYRYTKKISFWSFIKCFFQNPSFRFLYFYRRTNSQKRKTLVWLYYSIILKILSYRYGFQIPSITQIGPGFYIGHFGTIVINEKSTIGRNCNIAHNVTIGQISIGNKLGCPKINDLVWIGTGAVIVGGITIEKNVLIAPNSFVNFNVPSNSIVIGNPGKIFYKNNPTEGYILNII